MPPPRQKVKTRPESVGAAAQVEGLSSQPCTATRGKRVDSQHQQTAADVAAAAGAVAATAAFQVIQAAGKEVQAQLQVLPPHLCAQQHTPCSKVTASAQITVSAWGCILQAQTSATCLRVMHLELAMHTRPCCPACMLLLS